MSTGQIPIRNLYYLLAYAWEWFPESSEGELGLEACPDSLNLMAMLLCKQVQRLARRGYEKRYLSQQEVGTRISGRIELTETIGLLARQSRQVCFATDELSPNILPNRILKSTLQQLQSSEQLATSLRDDVWRASKILAEVEEIRLTSGLFNQLIFHRNNRHYRLALDICRMLHDLTLPDASKRRDQRNRFLDVFEDEACMARLFEKFVLNFARAHCPESHAVSQHLRWEGTWSPADAPYLPRMVTDITLRFPNRTVILDCKYYREALKSGLGTPKLHPGHLYQLLAYLQNSDATSDGLPREGVLLYPTNGIALTLNYQLLGFPIRIRTLDLSNEWPAIARHLQDILRGV